MHKEVQSISYKEREGGGRVGKGREREEVTYLYLASILEMEMRKSTQGKRHHLTESNGFPTSTGQTLCILWRSISDLKGGKSQERRGHGSQLLLGKLPKEVKSINTGKK